ncbi:MAG: CDP-glucose 4,6-dehydratase [Candidatus Latescibacteria bacterium]|nr:CDP-glucose 4,6-dehydratase [Candidatus Latescibacterota bacterium]
MYHGFYRDKTVLVTGIAGFKGTWLALVLLEAGAGEVVGLDKERQPRSNFVASGLEQRVTFVQGDIRDPALMLRVLTEYRVDVVFHLAAQAIVKTAFQSPVETVSANVLGTAVVLEAVRQAGTAGRCVVATSDKAYGDKGGALYVEDDPLRGTDVYSASKSAADMLTQTWFTSYFKPSGIHGGIVRCGNIIGGGDWAAGRIVVDCAKALTAGCPPDIHNPEMVRDYFYVLDAVSGYLSLGAALDQDGVDGEGFNFGPHEHDVRNADLATRICDLWDAGLTWRHTPPPEPFPEILKQTLSWEKARTRLGWAPAYTLDEALRDTVAWYQGWAQGARLDDLNVQLLHRHRDRARERGLAWAREG